MSANNAAGKPNFGTIGGKQTAKTNRPGQQPTNLPRQPPKVNKTTRQDGSGKPVDPRTLIPKVHNVRQAYNAQQAYGGNDQFRNASHERYMQEIASYPPAQQQQLLYKLHEQSSSSSLNNILNRDLSNPRFDMPRQQINNYMTNMDISEQLQSPPILNSGHVSNQQSPPKNYLLDQYLQQKFGTGSSQQNLGDFQQQQFPTFSFHPQQNIVGPQMTQQSSQHQSVSSQDIQRFIDFYNNFSQTQALNMVNQVPSMQQRSPQSPFIHMMPSQGTNYNTLPNPAERILEQQKSPSSDDSFKNFENMILMMKQDVLEVKQQLLQNNRASSSDKAENSHARQNTNKSVSGTSEKRVKSLESKSSNEKSQVVENSYKRRLNEMPLSQAPTQAKQEKQQQKMPETIFQAEEENKEMAYTGLRNKKQAPIKAPMAQFSDQTYNKRQPLEEEKHEVIDNNTPRRKLKDRVSRNAVEDVKSNTAELPQRNVLNTKEEDEFKDLNIKANCSNSSDEEREQRIFQFSPLSSKKQQDDDSGDTDHSGENRIQIVQNPILQLVDHEQVFSEDSYRRRDADSMANNNDFSIDNQRRQIMASSEQQRSMRQINSIGQSTGSFMQEQQEPLISENGDALVAEEVSASKQSTIRANGIDFQIVLDSTVQHLPELMEEIPQVQLESRDAQTDLKQMVSAYIQTDAEPKKQEVRNLSPFETYDYLFIRDLVNNLTFDNEVLHENAEDFKAAFMYLLNQHKTLQFQYKKEKKNETLIQLYRERMIQVQKEKDEALAKAAKLAEKVEMMNDIIQLTLQEQQIQQAEDTQLIDQLEEENKKLRELLGLHTKEEDHSEISKGLVSYEMEIQKEKDAYLALVREEQDIQFNREIDEHKEIIQKIYDEKLLERQDQIESELTEIITKELSDTLTEEIKQRVTDELRESLEQEVELKVKESMIKQLRDELQEQIKAELEEEYQERLNEEISKMAMQNLQVQNQSSLGGENNQTNQDLEALMRFDSVQKIKQRSSLVDDEEDNEDEEEQQDSSEGDNIEQAQATEKFGTFQQEEQDIDENEYTLKRQFQSEKSKFKEEMMRSVQLRSQKLLQPKPQPAPVVQAPIRKDPMRQSQQSSGKDSSEPSGHSDDWDNNDDQPNTYVFDDQALSKEEEELFNQLKEREQQNQIQEEGYNYKHQTSSERKREESNGNSDEDQPVFQDHSGNSRNNKNNIFKLKGNATKNERYYSHIVNVDLEERKVQQQHQDQHFHGNPDDQGNDDEPVVRQDPGGEQGIHNHQDQGIASRPAASMGQSQGFQGQANYGNNQPMSQGQARGGQRESSSSSLTTTTNRPSFGQGFQGQVQGYSNITGLPQLQLPEDIPFEERKTDRMGSHFISNSQPNSEERHNDDMDDIVEGYDDFFSGLQQQQVSESNLGPSEGAAHQDFFDDDDEDFSNQLDSTKGMRKMMQAARSIEESKTAGGMEIQDLLEQADTQESGDVNKRTSHELFQDEDDDFIEEFEDFDRDPDQEDVYDYFLDANKDENGNENQGYHIIDQEDLKQEPDEDDLDQIQDEEVREYRFNNMLEDLKESIKEDEENKNDQSP